MSERIVILGGGFAGVSAARALERRFGGDGAVQITLVSDENFLLFTPMLPQVVSGAIEPRHIISPIRASLRTVRFHNGDVRVIDVKNRRVVIEHCPACGELELEFDCLVLALGATANFYGLPDVARHALPMKGLADALALRNRVIDRFEHANMERDRQVRQSLLTFVVAGGGFAGTETVAELRDFAHTARRYYPNIHPEDVKSGAGPSGAAHHAGDRRRPGGLCAAEASTEGRGRPPEHRGQGRDGGMGRADDQRKDSYGHVDLEYRHRPPSPAGHAPLPRNRRGQVIVNRYLEVPYYTGVWAVGDCAEVPNPQTGQPYPPTAQHAVRQGKIVAENIHATLKGGRKKAFTHTPLGVLASLGRRSAVAEIGGFRFSGFFAWWLWRTVYLLKLPGLARKLRVASDWTLDLLFERDVVLLKLNTMQAPSETRHGAGERPARASPAFRRVRP